MSASGTSITTGQWLTPPSFEICGFRNYHRGCNKFCTYCIVPFSGEGNGLSAAEIVQRILMLMREGVKEVHLIGQNVNSYRPRTELD